MTKSDILSDLIDVGGNQSKIGENLNIGSVSVAITGARKSVSVHSLHRSGSEFSGLLLCLMCYIPIFNSWEDVNSRNSCNCKGPGFLHVLKLLYVNLL